VIVGTTNPGDVVLDPFFGTGTTGAVAKMLGRDFIGIEREPSYRKPPKAHRPHPQVRQGGAGDHRIEARRTACPSDRSWNAACCGRGRAVLPGNRFKAKVRADGTLIGNDVKGSIHQVGAALEGAPSCNGWTYWHFKRDGKMVPIDILRQQIRAEMEADGTRPH
jgi:modification methylase